MKMKRNAVPAIRQLLAQTHICRKVRDTLLGIKRHYQHIDVTSDEYGPRYRNGKVLVGLKWLAKYQPDVCAIVTTKRLQGEPLVKPWFASAHLKIKHSLSDLVIWDDPYSLKAHK